MDGLTDRLERTEEAVSEPEDWSTETIQSEERRKKVDYTCNRSLRRRKRTAGEKEGKKIGCRFLKFGGKYGLTDPSSSANPN